MKQKKIIVLLSVILIIVLAAALLIFRNSKTEVPEGVNPSETVDDASGTDDEKDKPVFEEELEGAEINKVKHKPADFIGTWKTVTSQAELYYGDMEISIKKNNTWSGTITDEPYSGTWEETNEGIILKCDIIDFKLAFTDKGNLILQEYSEEGEENGDLPLTSVLVKQ